MHREFGSSPEFESATRAGYVALVGRPNVGKSTLLNALIEERLSIVTPRAQTTRERVTGIYTSDEAQIIFIDTPGLLEPRYLLQHSMLDSALGALGDADIVLLILDATRANETFPDGPALERLQERRDSLLVVINKVDAAPEGAVDRLTEKIRTEFGVGVHRVAALLSEGIDSLRDALIEALPQSPFYFPPDEIAIQSVRFFVSELIRETVFEEYEEEVPYSTAVRIEEFREAESPVFIRAVVFVERDTQKAIIVGRRGAGIRRLGQRARGKIEDFLDARVYLDLWVKVMPRWRKKPGALSHLGYPVATSSHTRSRAGRGRRRARRQRDARDSRTDHASDSDAPGTRDPN